MNKINNKRSKNARERKQKYIQKLKKEDKTETKRRRKIDQNL